jgi:DNA topoisomerase-1
MVPAVLDTTQFDIKSGNYLFRSNGSILKFAGFMKVYVESQDDDNAEKTETKDSDRILPALKKSENLNLLEISPEQHFTQPPARFTEAMLVKELEEKGVGRPSTYASIISVIKDRDYIQNEERRLKPVELGFMINDLLVENFPDIMTTAFTAKMEEQLDEVEDGKKQWRDVLHTFYTPFKKDLEEAEKKMKDFKAEVEETDEVCEKCDKPMIIKWGRFGKFLACSAYPDCKNAKDIKKPGTEGEPEASDEVEGDCDKCKSPLIIKRGRFGKFIACSTYPDCKFTKPIGLGIKCPEDSCKGEIAPRRTKKGRTFYGCTKYPDCTFTSWDKPKDEACPECKHPFMVEKWKKNEEPSTLCPECGFKKTNAAA